jgi:predicted RNA-binding protein YlqC (UPF0109 family)
MKELIEYICQSLVDEPEKVEIRQFRRGSQVSMMLRVARQDMGRVIGKGGKVANALRTLLRVAAVQEGKRVNLDIVEPE